MKELFRFTLPCPLLFVSSLAVGWQGDGRRGNDWQKMPVSYETRRSASGSFTLSARVFNTDGFDKYCAVSSSAQITRDDGVVASITFGDTHDVVRAGALHEITRTLDRQNMGARFTYREGTFAVQVSCVGVDHGEELATIPSPREKCNPANSDCDNLCPAEKSNPRACELPARRISFAPRQTESGPIDGNRTGVRLHVANPNPHGLVCDFFLRVPAVNVAGDRYVVDYTLRQIEIPSTRDFVIAKALPNDDAPQGFRFQGRDATLLGTCRIPGEPAPAGDPLVLCNPERRAECNWVQ